MMTRCDSQSNQHQAAQTHLFEANVPLNVIQKWLGHKNLSTTLIYLHLTEKHDLMANPRWLGSRRVGFFGCLHTWGRDLSTYHPHVHFVVPGGGRNKNDDAWLSTPKNFLFPHAAACRV